MKTAALHGRGGAAALQFVEREPHEKGFARVFDRDIAPGLASLEKERLALRQTLFLRAALPAVALILTVAAFFWSASASDWWALYVPIAGLMATIGFGVYAYAPATQFADQSRELIMGPVCSFLGDLTYARKRIFDLQRFQICGIVDSFNKSSVEDVFTGTYRGTQFEMAEAHLQRTQRFGKNRKTYTVFRGLLIAVELGESAHGRVLISRDLGKIGNKISGWFTGWKGLSRVEFPNKEFESRFEVYAENEAEARGLLNADFLDTMVALANGHQNSAMRAGLVGGHFLLALPMNRNMFEPGSIFRSVYACESNIRDILGQITIAHRVIDFVKGDRPARVA